MTAACTRLAFICQVEVQYVAWGSKDVASLSLVPEFFLIIALVTKISQISKSGYGSKGSDLCHSHESYYVFVSACVHTFTLRRQPFSGWVILYRHTCKKVAFAVLCYHANLNAVCNVLKIRVLVSHESEALVIIYYVKVTMRMFHFGLMLAVPLDKKVVFF